MALPRIVQKARQGTPPNVHSKELATFQISSDALAPKPYTMQADADGTLVEKAAREESALRLHNYQKSISVLMSQHFDVDRLLLMHSTGVGKTITSLAVAVQSMHEEHRNVFVVGFSKSVFRRELLTRPEFKIVTPQDVAVAKMARDAAEKYRSPIAIGRNTSVKRDLLSKLRPGRVNSDDGSIFFTGYKELFSKMFVRLKPTATGGDVAGTFMSVKDVEYAIKAGYIKHNRMFWEAVQGAYIICDEIHNLYNSQSLNSWGVCVKYLLDNSVCKTILCSATPINNSPMKLVSVANLLDGNAEHSPKDFFTQGTLSDSGKMTLSKVLRNKVSYLVDRTGANYPELVMHGEDIAGDGYLKFVRCKVSALHAKTMRSVNSVAHTGVAMKKESRTAEADMAVDDSAPGAGSAAGDATDLGDMDLSLEDFEGVPLLDGYSRYLNDFVFPDPRAPDGPGIYTKAAVMKAFANTQQATQAFMRKVGIEMSGRDNSCGKRITGDFLTPPQLQVYSSKYAQFLKTIHKVQGKIFTYHNYVQLTGICLLREVLVRNGWVEWGQPPEDSTRCNTCWREQGGHGQGDKACVFTPLRFFVVTGGVNKSEIDSVLEVYNTAGNADGSKCRMILGSRAIKESYDLKAIQHMVVLHQPENISTFLQVLGRAVRNGSHAALPEDQRKVNLYILVSSLGGSARTFEEAKWLYKLRVYKEIQKINSILLESSVDYDINFDKNAKNTTASRATPRRDRQPLGISKDGTRLYDNFSRRPKMKLRGDDSPTYQAWWASSDSDYIRYVIKRLMLERSPIWDVDELWEAVKAPYFTTERNMAEMSKDSFYVALDSLLYREQAVAHVSSAWGTDRSTNGYHTSREWQRYTQSIPEAAALQQELNKMTASGKGFAAGVIDTDVTEIAAPDGSTRVLSQRGNIVFITRQVREMNPLGVYSDAAKKISVNRFVEDKGATVFSIEMEELLQHAERLQIEDMGNLLSSRSANFHRMAIARAVAVTNRYLLGVRMTASKLASPLYAGMGIATTAEWAREVKRIEAYRKLVYVYNKFRCIVWGNYEHPLIKEAYKGRCRISAKSEHTASAGVDFVASLNEELIDAHDMTMSKDCKGVIPSRLTFHSYYKYVKYWKPNAGTAGEPVLNCWNFCLPVGHLFDTQIAFIDPRSDTWQEAGIYTHGLAPHATAMGFSNKAMAGDWVDAGQVAGFLEKDRAGLGITFKLRLHFKANVKQGDSRTNVVGVNCANLSKDDINKVCEILKIAKVAKKRCACHVIKIKLIEKELRERLRGSNRRYFYFHWERQAAQ